MNISPHTLSRINIGLSEFLKKEIIRTKKTNNEANVHVQKQEQKLEQKQEPKHGRQVMQEDEHVMHGRLGIGRNWAPPINVNFQPQKSRPGYESMAAHEYEEDPAVLREKVAELARMLRTAKHAVAYTGAGISTASGIDDYASKGTQSKATGTGAAKYRPKAKKGLNAEPTFAHYTLAALEKHGMIHSWIQQNHDGLPQKARFPQDKINEIHGAWFDPSNPVVPMNGSLRDDLMDWLLVEEQKADLVLTMGTSLCGMNADRVVRTSSEKYCSEPSPSPSGGGGGLGSVIIGFQQTQLDSICSLRIFARIDEVMLLLAREMNLAVDIKPYKFKGKSNHRYQIAYDSNTGRKDISKQYNLCLQRGAKIKLTSGPGKGYVGTVVRTPNMSGGPNCSYTLRLPCTRENSPAQGKEMSHYALGGWIIEAAMRGELKMLPIVNIV